MTKMLQQLVEMGGEVWLEKVKTLSYVDARTELVKLCGVGRKVADCICLFGLEQYGAIPVDTHCWQIASRYNYIPKAMRSSLTAKGHDAIGDEFRKRFGETHAGWAFMVLFVAEVHPFTKRALHLPRTYPQRPHPAQHASSAGGGGGGAECEDNSAAKHATKAAVKTRTVSSARRKQSSAKTATVKAAGQGMTASTKRGGNFDSGNVCKSERKSSSGAKRAKNDCIATAFVRRSTRNING